MSAMAPALIIWLQTAADSAGTRVVVERNWLETIVNVGQGLVSLLVLLMLVLGVLLLYTLKKSIEEMTKLIKSVYEPVAEAAKETRDAARDLLALTKSARVSMDVIGETVNGVNEGAQLLVKRAEKRLRRLDALVEVVQDEAEDLVVGTAATLRGVRTSGALLGRFVGMDASNGARRRPRPSPRRDVVPVKDDAAADGPDNDDRAETEEENGIDAAHNGPRIRARRPAT